MIRDVENATFEMKNIIRRRRDTNTKLCSFI